MGDFDGLLLFFVVLSLAFLARRTLSGLGAYGRLVEKARLALLEGGDLEAIFTELTRAVGAVYQKRLAGGDRANVRRWESVEGHLRLVRAVVSIERGELDVATQELFHLGGAVDADVIDRRLAIVRGEPPRPMSSRTALSILQLIERDTEAQLLLAEGDTKAVLAMSAILPTTTLRALVARGKEEAAVHLVRKIAPSRLDAMSRLFPADPATLLVAKLRSGPTPYR